MATINEDFTTQAKVSTNSGLNFAVNGYSTFSQITDTAYTVALTDAADSKVLAFGNAAATSVSIPTNANVPFPNGSSITGIQKGAGKVTIVPAAGVTINSVSGYKAVSSQYGAFTLVKESGDVWYLLGSLSA